MSQTSIFIFEPVRRGQIPSFDAASVTLRDPSEICGKTPVDQLGTRRRDVSVVAKQDQVGAVRTASNAVAKEVDRVDDARVGKRSSDFMEQRRPCCSSLIDGLP